MDRRALKEAEDISSAINIDYLVEQVPRAISQSAEGVESIASIVTAMQEYAQPGLERVQRIDLNSLIEGSLAMSGNEWRHVAVIDTDFGAGLSLVPCTPSALSHAILHIVVNAAHAIREKSGHGVFGPGGISIVTRRVDCWAEVTIRDTGSGVPDGIKDRIFDPFFTTKNIGRGTGLGLAIAFNVITEMHNGRLSFETEEGVGTKFRIRLPLLEDEDDNCETESPVRR